MTPLSILCTSLVQGVMDIVVNYLESKGHVLRQVRREQQREKQERGSQTVRETGSLMSPREAADADASLCDACDACGTCIRTRPSIRCRRGSGGAGTRAAGSSRGR